MDAHLSFRESLYGAQKEVFVSRRSKCGTCGGSKCEPGTLPARCWTCYGKGFNVAKIGPFLSEEPCAKCDGTGAVIRTPCAACKGRGLVLGTEVDTIKVREEVAHGDVLEFEKKGHEGLGGHRGKLFVEVKVDNEHNFRKKDLDIESEQFIPISVAVLGGKVAIFTLNGAVNVFLPELMHNQIFTLKKEGLKCKKTGRIGDHRVKIIGQTGINFQESILNIFRNLHKEDEKVSK